MSSSYRYRLLNGSAWRDPSPSAARRRIIVYIGVAMFTLGLAAHWFVAPDAVKNLWESTSGNKHAEATPSVYEGDYPDTWDNGAPPPLSTERVHHTTTTTALPLGDYPDSFDTAAPPPHHEPVHEHTVHVEHTTTVEVDEPEPTPEAETQPEPEPEPTPAEQHDWPAPHHTIAAEDSRPEPADNKEHHKITDLGEIADARYQISFNSVESGAEKFFKRLYEFARRLPTSLQPALLASLHAHLPPSHADLFPGPASPPPPANPAMVAYKNIFQTDFKEPGELTQKWRDMNAADGWKLDWYDDARSEAWVRETFESAEEIEKGGVWWAYDYFKRGVLKADLLRYLLPLVKGGVYADVDTKPIRRIEEWGHLDVDVLDLEETDGPDWHDKLATNAAIMVGFETDVHEKEGWFNYWPRPVGVCQWALASAPNHPIMLEVVRRVVNGTHFVASKEGQDVDKRQSQALSVIEWTGPGAFSDAVFSYLLARYNVSWHHVRGLHRPLRVGDVLILPITAFASGGEGDFDDEGADSPQALLQHFLRGGWKGDGQ